MDKWPIEPWQSFFLWSEPGAAFLSNIPTGRIAPLTCINFMPDSISQHKKMEKQWDICVISRPSKIKRIRETLHILRCLLDIKPDLKAVIVVPDPRRLELGRKAYRIQGIDNHFFELPRKLFSSKELKNFSFLCSSQPSFGTFPLSNDLMIELVAKSRFLLLTSHREGIPRVIAEALLAGTPCIVSKFLRSGIQKHLTPENAIFIDDESAIAARQIIDGLNKYERYVVDREAMNNVFGEQIHLPKLQDYLSRLIHSMKRPIEGRWYLDDLHLRLACHGQKYNSQFMNNERLFFDWLAKIEGLKDREPEEDLLFGTEPLKDHEKLTIGVIRKYLRAQIGLTLRRGFAFATKQFVRK
jgi:glycosyltransferase involved in cell wall biosynthesis